MQINKYFKIEIKNLFLIQYILEGYEGLVTVTTLNSEQGLIKVSFPHYAINDINQIIQYLKKDFYFDETYQS
jgi:Domain of unknown function (DUF4911)